MPLLVLTGCLVGPDYRRPAYPIPAEFRGEAADTPTAPLSLGELAWWQIFEDAQLHALVRTALTANYDLRAAVSRVLQARARLIRARATPSPLIDVRAAALYPRVAGARPPLTTQETFQPVGSLDLAFELDLWGRLRRATESARADLLASEEARRTVVTTLVSEVATAYSQLREPDLQLESARRTLDSRRASRRLGQPREEGGVASLLDVRRAETLVYTAAVAIPALERRIAQTEHLLSRLVGRNPSAMPRGRPWLRQLALPEVPAGLPSARLERRPDSQHAERQLVAAHARIGAAKALLFPQGALTGAAGSGRWGWTGRSLAPEGGSPSGPPSPRPSSMPGKSAPGSKPRRPSSRPPSGATCSRSSGPSARSPRRPWSIASNGSSAPSRRRCPARGGMRCAWPANGTRAASPAFGRCWTPNVSAVPRN
jgi:multidrug efflux system outer membrane protein